MENVDQMISSFVRTSATLTATAVARERAGRYTWWSNAENVRDGAPGVS